jgi:hypothetical protein
LLKKWTQFDARHVSKTPPFQAKTLIMSGSLDSENVREDKVLGHSVFVGDNGLSMLAQAFVVPP